MLFYYQIVTCLLVTCCCCYRSTWVCMSMRRTACVPVKNILSSNVIMNEHLKLKTVNWDTVWGGVSSGEGTSPGAQNRQKLPILIQKYWALSILISDCCLLKFGCLLYMIYLRPQKFNFNTYWGRWLIGGGGPGPTGGIGTGQRLCRRHDTDRACICRLSSLLTVESYDDARVPQSRWLWTLG